MQRFSINSTLRTRLSLAFIAVSMISILLVSILVNFLLEKQFKEYIINKQEDRIKQIVKSLDNHFEEKSSLNEEIVENIGLYALDYGVIIRVEDSSGKVVWDAMEHNDGLCKRLLEHLSYNMTSKYPNWKGGYVEREYPITSNSNKVGKVWIGYYGPFYFNDNELYFINTLNKALIIITIVALAFSLLFGSFVSKMISVPIARVINATKLISRGKYIERIKDISTTKEIKELIESINSLVDNLEKQETLRKRLTLDMAHEIRTPIATLQSHVEAMIDGIWQPTPERLKSCHEEIIRINKMIGELDTLAIYESENLTLDKHEFNIKNLVSNIIMNFEYEFKIKDIRVQCSGKDEIIYADKDKISQVLINLISNTLKYTPKGGKVDIIIDENYGKTKIIIKDNGQGISKEDLPYIFERFYRADPSRNRMTGGSGIGLTIAKAIIDAHGGSIDAKSIINVGTEFVIFIPKHAI